MINRIHVTPCSQGATIFDDATEERLKNPKCIDRYGFKVYSQSDEDGIIQEIFHRIGITNKKFVEFGVQDGLESNCHYLLFCGWKGMWIEGNADYFKQIQDKFRSVIETGQLCAVHSFVTKENINSILHDYGYSGDIDLLSIDIDGNDYWVWKEIFKVSPRVVVIEYNAKFPPPCDWKMKYNPEYCWDGSDCHGASLKALELLGREKGYQLVGTNVRGGVNAFFVKEELTKNLFLEDATAENLYNPPRFHIQYTMGHPTKYCLL